MTEFDDFLIKSKDLSHEIKSILSFSRFPIKSSKKANYIDFSSPDYPIFKQELIESLSKFIKSREIKDIHIENLIERFLVLDTILTK